MPPKKTKAAAAPTAEIENENPQTVETEQLSPKKATTKKATRGRKKSEAEKLQEEATGFIDRVNKKSEAGDDSTEEEIEEEQVSKKKTNTKTATTGTARGGKRQPAKNMPTHDELNENEQPEAPVPTKTSAKSAKNDDDDVENEGDSPTKKPKAKPGRKPGQKTKTNPPEAEIENGNNDDHDKDICQ